MPFSVDLFSGKLRKELLLCPCGADFSDYFRNVDVCLYKGRQPVVTRVYVRWNLCSVSIIHLVTLFELIDSLPCRKCF